MALLFSGQNATLTGTLAGQIVMEGFLNIRLRPWLRRLITRLIAIIPALITVYFYGERGIGSLLVFSQVILSLQLPFAVFPLVMFTGDRRKMGALVAPRWMLALAWPVAVLIAASTRGCCGRRSSARRSERNVNSSLSAFDSCTSTSSIAIENSDADRAVLAHIEPLARMTGRGCCSCTWRTDGRRGTSTS